MVTILNDWKKHCAVLLTAGCALIGLYSGGAQAASDGGMRGPDICAKTSQLQFKACHHEARDDAQVESAMCLNLGDIQAREDCMNASQTARLETVKQCGAIRQARNEICTKLGMGGAYNPVIDPANFVTGINNRFTPFPKGAFRVYEKTTADGVERIRVELLPETRVIMGVTVTTLRDTVTLDGVVIEDTKDWIAQDKDGNVWYFGEIVQNFEDGLLANLDGSFEAGKDGAKAGFWSKAAPIVGETYRQEWALGNAEDIVEVVSLNATDTVVPFSAFGTGTVLKTKDTTPMSPGVVEFKYYVPGIGFALEVKPATGERLELIDYGPK